MKIIMLCGPARCGKDTITPILKKQLEDKYGGIWEQFAFANKLKKDCEEHIQKTYGVSVWDDSKKHLFRNYLIEYGEKRRAETNNKYLVNYFIHGHNDFKNYIISDYRFLTEYIDIKSALAPIYGTELKIIPIYIERVIDKNGLKLISQPTLKPEVENYPSIKKISKVYQIPWETGLLWNRKLSKFSFNL